MGARQSTVYASNGANKLFMRKKSGQVLSFHSSAKWKSHLQASKGTNKLMVIHFKAAWCKPCRTMEPIIREFAATFLEVDFIEIDVDELESVAQDYVVQALPAFVLVKNGKTVDKLVGAQKEALQKRIEKCMGSNIYDCHILH